MYEQTAKELKFFRSLISSSMHESSHAIGGIGQSIRRIKKLEPLPRNIAEELEFLERNFHVLKSIHSQTSRLLTSSLSDMSTVKVVDVTEVLIALRLHDSFQTLLRQKGVTIEIDGNSKHKYASCDVKKLEHVIINIIKNSVEAYSKFGTNTKRIEIQVETCNSEVEIKISDFAGGISRDVLENVSAAFFTTKSQPDHDGLGLTVSNKLMESMGGRLSIQSENDWTTVSLYLPMHDKQI